ncbi:hypothetical protein BHE74_00055743 [Ensete ventricosum]|nr:hypothetical protein BHE74_00055743 [Ensete ventricosum]
MPPSTSSGDILPGTLANFIIQDGTQLLGSYHGPSTRALGALGVVAPHVGLSTEEGPNPPLSPMGEGPRVVSSNPSWGPYGASPSLESPVPRCPTEAPLGRADDEPVVVGGG